MKKMKKFFLPFMMLGILLLVVGCTNSEETGDSSEGSKNENVDKSKEAKENIKTVFENMFTGPDEEQEILLKGAGDDIEKFSKTLSDYQEENFKPYMNDDFYENHILKSNRGISFLLAASPTYMLNVDEITLEEREAKEGDYDFNVKVTYTNKDNEESETKTIEGTASTNEEGKITSIRYLNDEEFYDALRE